MNKRIHTILKRYIAILLIFNHLFIFCSQAIAIPHADVSHLHDIFGEETTSHIVRRAKNVPITKRENGTYSLDLGVKNVSVTKGATGTYSLPLDSSQEPEVIYFHDGEKGIGTWLRSQGHAVFIGSKETESDVEVDCPLVLSSLKVEMDGHLRFLQDVALKEVADIASRSLSIAGSFTSQKLTQFTVQENMEVLEGGNLRSVQQIKGKFKSLVNRGSISAQDDISLEGETIANNGLIEGSRKLVLQATTLINRACLKAETLAMHARKALENLSRGLIDVANQCEISYAAFKNDRGTIKVGKSLKAEGDVFENNGGTVKVNGSFVVRGEDFQNRHSSSSWGTLEVGTPEDSALYQVQVNRYIDSGKSTWNGLALIQAQIVDLAGSYACANASMIAAKSFIARGESQFSVNHCLELKSNQGVVDFGGVLSVSPTIKKQIFSQKSALASFVAQMPEGITLAGCKQLTHRGTVCSPASTSIARYSSAEGKFIFTGQSHSSHVLVSTRQALLEGVLHSSENIILSVQEDLRMVGEVATRNLKAVAQSLFVSGSVTTIENALLQGEEKVEVAKTGSLQIGEALAVNSKDDVILDGTVQTKRAVAQGNTITHTGSFSVDEFAHFKADTYFANLWSGHVRAKNIQIDAGLILNFLGTLKGSSSLTTNALFDVNLGLKTAHHIRSSSLLSLDAGLSLPSLHPKDLLSWDTVMKGLRATALSFCPADTRSLINLGIAAFSVCTQASELHKKYASLEDKPRFSDIIPFLVGIKDLGISAYTTAKSAGALIPMDQEVVLPKEAENLQQVSETSNTRDIPSETNPLSTKLLQAVPGMALDVAKAGASVLMPSITQDSLLSVSAGLRFSGIVYERGIASTHTGITGSSIYTNDALYAANSGLVASRQIQYANTQFYNGGALVGGDVRVKATKSAENTGLMVAIGDSHGAVLEGKTANNSGIIRSSGVHSRAAVIGTDDAKNTGVVTSIGDDSSAMVQGKGVENSGLVASSGDKSQATVKGTDQAKNIGAVENSGDVRSEGAHSQAAVIGTDHARNTGTISAEGDEVRAILQGNVAENAGTLASQGTSSQAALLGTEYAHNEGIVRSTGDHSSSLVQAAITESSGDVRSEGAHSQAAVIGTDHARNTGTISAEGDEVRAILQGNVAENAGTLSSQGTSSQAALLGTEYAHNEGIVRSTGDHSSSLVKAAITENSGTVRSEGAHSQAAVIGTDHARNTGMISAEGDEVRAILQGNVAENAGTLLSQGTSSQAALMGSESAHNEGSVKSTGDHSSSLVQAAITESSGDVMSEGAHSQAAVIGTDHARNTGMISAEGDEVRAILQGNVAENAGTLLSQGTSSHAALLGTEYAHNEGIVRSTGDHSSSLVQAAITESSGDVMSEGAHSQAAVIGTDHTRNSGTISAEGDEVRAILQGNVAENAGTLSSQGASSQAALLGTEYAHNEGSVRSTGDHSSSLVQAEITESLGDVRSEGAHSQAAVIGVDRARNSGTISAEGDEVRAILQGNVAENAGTLLSQGASSQAALLGTEYAHNEGSVRSTGDHSSATVQGKTVDHAGTVRSIGDESQADVIGEESVRTQIGSTVSAEGNKSSAAVEGNTVNHSGKITNSGAEGAAIIMAQSHAENSGSVEATGTQGHAGVHGKSVDQKGGVCSEQGTAVVSTRSQVEKKEDSKIQGDVRTFAGSEVSGQQTLIEGNNVDHQGTVKAAQGTVQLSAEQRLSVRADSQTQGKNVILEGQLIGDVEDALQQIGRYQGVKAESYLGVKTDEAIDIRRQICTPYSLSVEGSRVDVHHNASLGSNVDLIVKAHSGDIANHAAIIKGGRYTELEASGDVVNNHRKETHVRKIKHGHKVESPPTFVQGYIGGGTGVDYEYTDPETGAQSTRKIGLVIKAGGRVDNHASAIDSFADVSIVAEKGFSNTAAVHSYLSHYHVNDRRWKGDKYTYVWDASVGKSQVNSRQGKVSAYVNNGNISSSSGLFSSRDGTDLSAQHIKFEDVVTQHRKLVVRDNHIGGKVKDKHMRETSHPVVLQDWGNSRIVGREGIVDVRGAIFQGDGHLTIQGKSITLGRSLLHHSSDEHKSYVSVRSPLATFSTSLSGSKRSSALDVSFTDPLLMKARALAQSGNRWEYLFNGVKTGIETLESTHSFLKACRNDAFGSAFLQRYGLGGGEGFNPSLTFGFSTQHTHQDWMTTGPGSINKGSIALLAEEDINLYNGFSINTTGDAVFRAQRMYQNGARLESHYSAETRGINVGVTPQGGIGSVGVEYNKTESYSETWDPSIINIGGHLHIDVEQYSQDAGSIHCNKISGNIGDFRATTRQDYTTSLSFGGSVDTSGNFSFNRSQNESRQANHVAGIFVNGDIENDFSIGRATLTGAHIIAQGYNNADIDAGSYTPLYDYRRNSNIGFSSNVFAFSESPTSQSLFHAPVHLNYGVGNYRAVHTPTIGGVTGTSDSLQSLGSNSDVSKAFRITQRFQTNISVDIPVAINTPAFETFTDNLSWAGRTLGHSVSSPLSHALKDDHELPFLIEYKERNRDITSEIQEGIESPFQTTEVSQGIPFDTNMSLAYTAQNSSGAQVYLDDPLITTFATRSGSGKVVDISYVQEVEDLVLRDEMSREQHPYLYLYNIRRAYEELGADLYEIGKQTSQLVAQGARWVGETISEGGDMLKDGAVMTWEWANKPIELLREANTHIDESIQLERDVHREFIKEHPFWGTITDAILKVDGQGPYSYIPRLRNPMDCLTLPADSALRAVTHNATSGEAVMGSSHVETIYNIYNSTSQPELFRSDIPPTWEEIESVLPLSVPPSMVERYREKYDVKRE